MTDPAYYRDLLNRILCEEDENPHDTHAMKDRQAVRKFMLTYPTDEEKIKAIQQNGALYTLIPNPSEQVSKALVTDQPFLIGMVKNPSEAVQLAAVNVKGTAIVNIENPSHAVKIAAVKNTGYALEYIENPDAHLVDLALKTDPELAMGMSNLSDVQKKQAAILFAEKYPRKIFKSASNFHKMLQYINDHPGDVRSGWYKRGLGNNPEGMASYTSPKALDGIAAFMGLITSRDPGKSDMTYQLRITPKGKRVLARLDNGEKLRLSDLLNT